MTSNEVLEALERREYERALALLEPDLAARPDGELHALAALANFQLEHYDAAAQHYAAALHVDGERSDWRDMLAVAQANATAGVNVHVPELHYFDRTTLLAPPSVRAGALPPPLPPAPGARPLHATAPLVGRVVGRGSRGVAEQPHPPGGLDRRLPRQGLDELVPPPTGAGRPDPGLHARAAEFAQPEQQLPGRDARRLPASAARYRPRASRISAPPTEAGTISPIPWKALRARAFCATSSSPAIHPETGAQLLTPNPREISRRLLTRPSGSDGRPAMTEVPFLNLLAASWIQFMNGDWINHGEILSDSMIEVPLRGG